MLFFTSLPLKTAQNVILVQSLMIHKSGMKKRQFSAGDGPGFPAAVEPYPLFRILPDLIFNDFRVYLGIFPDVFRLAVGWRINHRQYLHVMVAVRSAMHKDRYHGGLGLGRDDGQSRRCAGRTAEEIHKDAAIARPVLIKNKA